ncbi:MAG: hypothetical protein OXB92_06230, partial [Acidimicrobiaceae bacterium]|nr:hypothetical protein [Acidimicrobiaceae bacterium]
SMIATLRTDETAWSQGAADAAFSLAGAQAKTALRYEQGRWWQPYGDYDVCSILPYRDLIQPGTTVPVRQLRLAMKVGRDYTIHKTDYRLAWERTSQALGLPPQETLTRAEELAQGVTAAVEQAIDETPRPMRASPFVARLHAEVKQRADHCAFIQLMHRPSQYAKITPGHDTGSSLRTTSKPAASHPVTRNRCTHIGERSAKRCRLPRGHARPHRYPKS